MFHKSTMLNGRGSAQAERRLRARVAAAFRNAANGTDGRTAQDRTWDFFSSSGADWTRRLK
jgi:hypothetical protein